MDAVKIVRKVPRFGIDLQVLDENGKPVVVEGQQLHPPAIAEAIKKAGWVDKKDESK
jgi:hypothetical protein